MFVFSNASCSVLWKGSTVRLAKGDVWRADDPFVIARPDFFDKTPTRVHFTRGGEPPVESATARPGEKRATRRG